MKFCWFTDTHLADVGPSMRRETYTDDILAKINEVADIAQKIKADYTIFGGDFFHNKLASKITHGLVNKALTALNNFPSEILWLIGSHDISYGKIDTLHRRPIGTILKHPKVRFLNGVTNINITDKKIIRFIPVSDTHNKPTEVLNEIARLTKESFNLDFTKEGGSYYDVLLLHQPVVKHKEGVTYPYEVIRDIDLFGMADLVLYGHMHNYDGTWKVNGCLGVDENDMDYFSDTWFSNVGSIARTSTTDFDRMPKCLVFDISVENIFTYKEVDLKSAKKPDMVFKSSSGKENTGGLEQIQILLDSVNEAEMGLFNKELTIEKILNREYPIDLELTEQENKINQQRFQEIKIKVVSLLENV